MQRRCWPQASIIPRERTTGARSNPAESSAGTPCLRQSATIADRWQTVRESSADRCRPARGPSRAPSARWRASRSEKACMSLERWPCTSRRKRWRPRISASGASAGPRMAMPETAGADCRRPRACAFGLRTAVGGDDDGGEPAEGRQHRPLALADLALVEVARIAGHDRLHDRMHAAGRSGSGRGSSGRSARPAPSPATEAGRSARPRADRRSRGRDRHRRCRPASSAGNCAPSRRAGCR